MVWEEYWMPEVYAEAGLPVLDVVHEPGYYQTHTIVRLETNLYDAVVERGEERNRLDVVRIGLDQAIAGHA